MKKSKMPAVAAHGRPGLRSCLSDKVLARWNENIQAMDDHQSSENVISIMDVVGEDFWGDGVSAKRIQSQLRAYKGEPVIININSPGGNFFEGLAIYNVLRQYTGRVTVRVLGIAASAAAVIAMGGDVVEVARSGFLMIHNTSILAAVDRNKCLEIADWLKPFDDTAAEIFSSRTGIKQTEISKMLDHETWIGGKQAIDDGFADDYLEADLIDGSPANKMNGKPIAAHHEVDQNLAKLGMPRSKRRDLLAAIRKSGMPCAADNAKPKAGVPEALKNLTSKIAAL